MMRPLAGIRVIDLSTVVMGPYASQLLADFGAEVIKVEAPDGDSTRWTGPSTESGMSAIFLGVNRNKESVVLDLKTSLGQQALWRLVETAHVFIHSMRPQKTQALGIDPETLRARNPRLVYAAMHGFISSGPYGGKPAYDDVIQGLSGLAALMELQGGEPRYLPTIAADKISGLYAATAILAALNSRERTGKGSFVEVPMFESMVSFNLVEHLFGQHFNPALTPFGYPRVLAPWRRPHKTADGFLCAMPYTDRHWRDLFAEVGESQLITDPRFVDISARTHNITTLYEVLARIILTRTTADWLEIFERIDVPAAPVHRLPDLLCDPHLLATGFFEDHDDANMGRLRFTSVPVLFDGERMPIAIPPRLGEHTRKVLTELGMSDEQITALIASSMRKERPAGLQRANEDQCAEPVANPAKI
jgi:crotonobetainyl-CoA:carnitine CoA-transferase CaiB-like acyl-CoA transferase